MTAIDVFMAFPAPQREATFLRRPQRFLAEMQLPDGSTELVYCANSGAMTGCLTPDRAALLWESADTKRKLRYTWRAVEFEGIWIGTDTHLSNRIIEEALRLKLIPSFESYSSVEREKLVESGFRIDFVLSGSMGDCLVEVKSCAIVENGVARYPDSSTPRGVKHLKALTRHVIEGTRAVLILVVQREDAYSFQISNSFDPAYATAFDEAIAAGVEVIALAVPVCPAGFRSPRILPYVQEPMVAMKTNGDSNRTEV